MENALVPFSAGEVKMALMELSRDRTLFPNKPRLEAIGLYKLPDVLYQEMFSMAQMEWDREIAKYKILRYLKEAVKDWKPGYELNNFIDLNKSDVAQLEAAGINLFEWGMYVQLRPVGSELLVLPLTETIQNLLT